jgi:hypothetical protein
MPPFPRYRPNFPAYLRDPSYYRMAYQLVALYANEGSESRSSAESGPASKPVQDEGIRHAEELAEQMRQVLDWFEWRQQGGWSRLRLDKQELRLQRFLAGTVEPCVALALEGLEFERDLEQYLRPETEEDVEVELELAFMRRRPRVVVRWTAFSRLPRIVTLPWSYRAFYNLACLCAVRGRVGAWDWRTSSELCEATGLPPAGRSEAIVPVGLWAMEQALSMVHGTGLTGLLKLAEADPTLEPMRTDEVFGPEYKELLAQFKVPRATGAAPAEPTEEGLSADELRAFVFARDEFGWEPLVAAVVMRAGLAQKSDPASRLVPRLDEPEAWRVLHDLAVLGEG